MSDSETPEQLGTRLTGMIAGSVTALSFAVGQSLGIVQYLCEHSGTPMTSQHIADDMKLRERYVREWLNCMACTRVVDIDSEGKLYTMLPEKAAVLMSDGFKSNNMFVYFLEMAGSHFNAIQDCFSPDGPPGIDYMSYKNFHKQMAEMTSAMMGGILPEKLAAVFPDDLKKALESSSSTFLDVGVGPGVTTVFWAKAYPHLQIYGMDFSEKMIAEARARLVDNKITNVKLEVLDACNLDPQWDGFFDVMCATDTIHDMAYPEKALLELYRVLKPGGYLIIIDIDGSSNPAKNIGPGGSTMYSASLFHCMPVSLNFPGGKGYGTLCGREQHTKMLKDAGFNVVAIGGKPILQENLYVIAKKEK